MRIVNISTHTVAYKLKSTAPKSYSIKPSQATLKQSEAFDVQIVRRPPEPDMSEEEPGPGVKAKKPDRFLVQAAILDTDEKKQLTTGRGKALTEGFKKFWGTLPKDELQEQQLEVVLVDGACKNGVSASHPEVGHSKDVEEMPRSSPADNDAGVGKEPETRKGKVAAREPSDGKGAGKEHVNGKGNGKDHSDGKGAGKEQSDSKGSGKEGKDGKEGKGKKSKDGKDGKDGKGSVSQEGHGGPPEGPPPGPPPGFGGQRGAGAGAAPASPDSPGVKKDSPRPQALKKPTQRKHEDVVLQKHSRPVTCVLCSPCGKELYTCGKDKLVYAWSCPDGDFVRQYEGHRGAVWACAVTPDSMLLLTCGADSMVLLWEVASARRLVEVQLPGVARCVEWMPCGERSLVGNRHFAACNNNFKDRPAALSVWNTHDLGSEPHELLTIKELPGPATQIAWAGPGCEVLCSVVEEVLFWHGETGAQLGRLEAHTGATSMVAFAKDRTLMASAGRVDMTVKLWDLTTGLSTGEASCLQTFAGDRPLNCVALRASITRGDASHWVGACDCLAGGGQDARDVALVGAGTDNQFDPVTMRLGADDSFEEYIINRPDFRAAGHFGPIHALAFSMDGAFCISGSEDGNVRIRDLFLSAGKPCEGGSAAALSVTSPTLLSAALPRSKAAQPKPSPKTQPKAQPKATVPKVELATQIPSQRQSPPPSKPTSPSDGSTSRVIAVYDFDPMTTGWPFGAQQRPLPFCRGQELEILKDLGGGWGWGQAAGNQGLFPMNYVLPMAEYQKIMQTLLVKAAAPSLGSQSPVPAKPSSPPVKPRPMDPASLPQLDARAHQNAGLGLPMGVSGGIGSRLTAGMTEASFSSGGGGGGIGLQGGLSGEPMTIGGMPSGLIHFAEHPAEVPAKASEEEEEGDCSQS